jgi:hypothetical protein
MHIVQYCLELFAITLLFSAVFSAPTNSINSFTAQFNIDNNLVLSYKCNNIVSDANILLLDPNGSYNVLLQNISCKTDASTTIINGATLPSDKTLTASIKIKTPCNVCTRSSQVYVKDTKPADSIPDSNIFAVIALLGAVVFCLYRRK